MLHGTRLLPGTEPHYSTVVPFGSTNAMHAQRRS
jgi:hypothetical protein